MTDSHSQRKRYRFGEFVLSPSTRILARHGRPIPLIPRYLDLLLLLIDRRSIALTRDEIMESVWSDVVVSDGALSQAVRTLRRALGDDPRSPRYIRTVSRHGYQFVFERVTEEDEAAGVPVIRSGSDGAVASECLDVRSPPDPFEEQLAKLLAPGAAGDPEDDLQREAAERLHELGTREALHRLGTRPGHERAWAILRDVRWEVPGAGEVPLLGLPGSLRSLRFLAGMRMRRAARLVRARWVSAALGGALAGIVAGAAGGLAIDLVSGVEARVNLPLVLAVVGATIGAIGAAGVGAGLSVAEAVVRSFRTPALILLGAAGGGLIGLSANVVGRMVLEGLFGGDLSLVGGAFEGILLGGAAGAGYGLSTPRPEGGMAAPHGLARLRAILATGITCALAGLVISWMGGHLGGSSLDVMARTFRGSQVGLDPLAPLFGERGAGPLTRAVLSAYEGLFFGAGLIAGLTRRPRSAP